VKQQPPQELPLVPVKTEPKAAEPKAKSKGKLSQLPALRGQLVELQTDARFLETQYPKLGQAQQQVTLSKLREKYKAPKTANSIHVQKLIRDEMQRIRDQMEDE
jgi:hypothetical protein